MRQDQDRVRAAERNSEEERLKEEDEKFPVNLTYQPFAEHEKLISLRNYSQWHPALGKRLRTAGLTRVFFRKGNPQSLRISAAKLEQLKGLAVQILRSSVSESMSLRLASNSPLEMYWEIMQQYRATVLAEYKDDFFQRFDELHDEFIKSYDPHQYNNNFKCIIDEYEKQGMIFNHTGLFKAYFLERIDSIHDRYSPFYAHYKVLEMIVKEENNLEVANNTQLLAALTNLQIQDGK